VNLLFADTPISDTDRLWSLVGGYYDPATDQFLNVDPLVALTGQPYAFTEDDPINGSDPLGLSAVGFCSLDGCPNEAGNGAVPANFAGTANKGTGAACCSTGTANYPPKVAAEVEHEGAVDEAVVNRWINATSEDCVTTSADPYYEDEPGPVPGCSTADIETNGGMLACSVGSNGGSCIGSHWVPLFGTVPVQNPQGTGSSNDRLLPVSAASGCVDGYAIGEAFTPLIGGLACVGGAGAETLIELLLERNL
jgi:RHS repeat-associated protein